MKIKKLDFILFAVPLLIAAAALIFLLNLSGDKPVAEIYYKGECVRTINLDDAADTVIDLHLEYGNIIEIKNHKIRIKSAECGDKTCVKTGFISNPGETIACVPGNLVIKIVGKNGDYDIIAGMKI